MQGTDVFSLPGAGINNLTLNFLFVNDVENMNMMSNGLIGINYNKTYLNFIDVAFQNNIISVILIINFFFFKLYIFIFKII